MSERRIVARGLTPNERYKPITLNGPVQYTGDFVLKEVEHFDGPTVLTVVTTVEVPHDMEVVVHE
jgi:hypothetical protein